MELREVLSKKPIKFLTLLLTAMLVATASAAVYYSLNMQPTVTVATAAVTFTAGNDSTEAGASFGTNNTHVSLSGLKAYPNVTLTYDQAVNLTNNEASAHSVQLRHVSITPGDGNQDVSNFTSITFRLIASNSSEITSFAYTTTGDNWNEPSDTGYFTMLGNEEWTVKVEIVAAAGASTGIDVNIRISVDVQ